MDETQRLTDVLAEVEVAEDRQLAHRLVRARDGQGAGTRGPVSDTEVPSGIIASACTVFAVWLPRDDDDGDGGVVCVVSVCVSAVN